MIEIKYNGKYPNLCRGQLIVIINDKEWIFPNRCLLSGGNVHFNSDGSHNIETGEWDIISWPDDFPEELKEYVLIEVNDQIDCGCCGGCL